MPSLILEKENSFLGQGCNSIDREAFAALFHDAAQILALDEANLPTFPIMEGRTHQ